MDHVRAILKAVDPGCRPGAGRARRLLDAYAQPALLVPPAVDGRPARWAAAGAG